MVAGVVMDFPADETASSSPPRLPRRLRRRLDLSSKTPNTVEQIQTKLRLADLRRQVFPFSLLLFVVSFSSSKIQPLIFLFFLRILILRLFPGLWAIREIWTTQLSQIVQSTTVFSLLFNLFWAWIYSFKIQNCSSEIRQKTPKLSLWVVFL